MDIYLCTKSKIKFESLQEVIEQKEISKTFNKIIPLDAKTSELVEQPVDSAIECAQIRLKKAKEMMK